MAESTKVDLLKIKFPDVVRTQEVKVPNFAIRHTIVSTTITKIAGEYFSRNSIVIRNLSADTVWIGNSVGLIGGANGNGFPIRQNETLTITYSYGEIYAVVEANTSILAILEE